MKRCSRLVLEARAQDEVVVGQLHAAGHQDAFGLPVDAHHLPGHRGNAGLQGELGQVSSAVCMTAGREALKWRLMRHFLDSPGRGAEIKATRLFCSKHFISLCYCVTS